MRYLWNAFRMALGSQLRSWKTWLLLLLLPGLIWALTAFLPVQERAAPVQVGVVLPEQGGDAFWTLLEQRSGTVVTFIQADQAAMEGMVASGQWDCGLLLPEDFQARLAALDTDQLITLYISSGSAVYPLVREAVTACLAELLSPGMAQDYLLDSGILDADTLQEALPRLREILPDEDRVLVTMTTQDGRALDALTLADDTMANLLRGMIAMVLMIWTLFAAVDLGRWLATPAAKRLHALCDPTQLLLPRAAAAAVPALCSAGLALCLLPQGFRGLPDLLAYLSALYGLSLLAARFRPVWSSLPVLMPFVPVLCLILSPIVFDLSVLFPALAAFSRWTPVTLYLRGDTLPLWLVGIGALLLSFGLDKRHPIRR